MSITVMKYVWENSQSTDNARLILLAIADNANEVGDAFPGVDRLAAKSNISERTTQRMIQHLERLGELQVFPNAGYKTSSGWTNLYRVVLKDVKQNPVYSCKGEVVQPRPIKEVTVVSPLENDEEIDTSFPQGVTTVTPKPSDSNTKEMSTSLVAPTAATTTSEISSEATCAKNAQPQLPLILPPEPNLPTKSPYKAIVTTATEAEVVVGDEKPNKTKGGRKRAEGVTPAECINPMKAAIMKAFGWSWKTAAKNEKGQVNAAAKQLCEVDFPVEQIAALYEFCEEKFDKFGPMALTTNQSEFRKEHKPKQIAPELVAPQKKVVPVGIRSIIESGEAAKYGINPADYGMAS